MKIRNGFVSNSSSSSFLIYGVELAIESEKREGIENLAYKAKMACHQHDDGGLYLGHSWDAVRDDETGKQFKDRTEAEVKKILEEAKVTADVGELKFGTHEDAWYNG